MIKQLITTTCILGLAGVVIGVVANAAGESDSASVSATVTPMQISVSVAPTSTDYGVMGVSEVKKADTANPDDEFIVTNTGNVAENFDIIGDDATGGATWTLADTVGADQYVHAYSALKTLTATTTLGSSATSTWVTLAKTPTYKTLATNVGVSAPQDLVLEILTPSSVSDLVLKSTAVTVRATAY